MSTAFGKVEGIGVDIHVHRICNRLGWTNTANKSPEHTRYELEAWLPKSYWSKINKVFVGFGQVICTNNNPRCFDCLVNDKCPSAFIVSKMKKSLTNVKAV